jgi:hypothetical protein
MQYGFLATDYKRVSGVVPALKPRNSCGTIRKQVHNLSFALVTPLSADDNDVFSHGLSDR